MSTLTLVVPCYNEASRLDVQAWCDGLHTQPDLHLLFVDDGSTDGTRQVLDTLCEAGGARITALSLPRNGGKAEAVRQGMLHALREGALLTGYWDADLATPLDQVPVLRQTFHDDRVRIAMGARVRLMGLDIQRRTGRHYAGRLFASLASVALGVPVYDTQCGAKLLSAHPSVREALSTPFSSRWVFDVQLLARLIALEGPGCIREIPLNAWQDVAGSKIKGRDLARVLVDLARMEPDLARARRIAQG